MSDIEKSVRVLKRDKRFAPLVKKHGIPQQSSGAVSGNDMFQALVRAIVSQQISGSAARAIHTRVKALFPRNRPTPALMLTVSVRKLRACGLSVQKVNYLKDLALKFSDGTIRPRAFGTMSSDDIIEHLVRVKGIGVWTAHMVLLFTLNRPDILPTGDLGIRKGFQILYRLRELPDHAKMEKLARPWRAHASAASWYLWRAADAAKEKRKV